MSDAGRARCCIGRASRVIAGRLCGLDPAAGMLEQARKRSDIEWILRDLSSVSFDREFDLVVMTGHAFQVAGGGSRAARSARRDPIGSHRSTVASRSRLATLSSGNGSDGLPTTLPRLPTPPAPSCGWCAQGAEASSRRASYRSRTRSPVRTWDRPQVSHSTLRFLDIEFAVDRSCPTPGWKSSSSSAIGTGGL